MTATANALILWNYSQSQRGAAPDDLGGPLSDLYPFENGQNGRILIFALWATVIIFLCVFVAVRIKVGNNTRNPQQQITIQTPPSF